MTIVYQTEAYNYTPKKVAEEFARVYFDKPREIENMNGDKFNLVNGTATYQVNFIKGKHLISLDAYQVVRL